MGLRPERAYVVEIAGGKSGWNTNTEWEVRKQIRGRREEYKLKEESQSTQPQAFLANTNSLKLEIQASPRFIRVSKVNTLCVKVSLNSVLVQS